MLSRLPFIGITVFFVTMNVLLWRSEISGRNKLGASIPADLIWEKITTAPDDSALELRQRGKKIGYCRWSPNVGGDAAAATGKRMTEDLPPEGMVRQVTGYSIDFDGSFAFAATNRVRFSLHLNLSTNHLWQTLALRVNLHSATYLLNASDAREEIVLAVEESGATTQQRITYDEARNPEKLLRELGGPFVAGMIKAAGLPLGNTSQLSAAAGLKWEARHDWMTIGHARIRVYRLQTRILNRFPIVVLVSHVGEILRVELPEGIVLMNDALLNL